MDADCGTHAVTTTAPTEYAILVIQASVRRQDRPSRPLGILGAQKRNQGRNVIDLADACCCRRRVNQGLHVLEELLVALEPLVCEDGVSRTGSSMCTP